MKKIVLGSGSPRRKELLASLGFEFTIRTKDTDESCPEDFPLYERALYIAEKKAAALLPDLAEDEILLCADTMVLLNSEMINKPSSYEDAVNMLSKLSGNVHEVITSVVIQTKSEKLTKSVLTKVYFEYIPQEDIIRYVKEFNPLDKAGSYGIQEWIGHAYVKKIEGSFNNVIGLPTVEVNQILHKLM
ncbi:MAG: Maf family nucleotide pyrophosphatase [Bacteroidota bacterium]